MAGQISAIHIHHGLQKAADDFEAHCVAFCKLIQVPLKVIRVDAKNTPGQSPEAAAREARYGAFIWKIWLKMEYLLPMVLLII
jgi:tRNA(Ile)-lysidine synthase